MIFGHGGVDRRYFLNSAVYYSKHMLYPNRCERDGSMKRDAIEAAIIRIFEEKFEILDPGADDNLREAYEFDSIDAVELLHEIEVLLGTQLTQAEKKNAMEIRTINQILDYIEALAHDRCPAKSSGSDPCLSIVEP